MSQQLLILAPRVTFNVSQFASQVLWYNNPNTSSLSLFFKPIEEKLSADESKLRIMQEYKLKDLSQVSLDQGLRMAAYNDNFSDTMKFLKIGSNINAQE